jgi:hypothetical protein
MKKILILCSIFLITGCAIKSKGDSAMAKEKIKIRFFFSHLFYEGDDPSTNTFKVYIDKKLVVNEIHIDRMKGHHFLQKIVEVEKGHHVIEAKYLEINATGKYEKEFTDNIGLEVYSGASPDGVPSVEDLDKVELYFNEFPFNKVFKIR